jgi:hypothetical protein
VRQLTPDEISQAQAKLLATLARIKEVEADKKDAADNFNDELKIMRGDVDDLCLMLTTGQIEEDRQMHLFGDPIAAPIKEFFDGIKKGDNSVTLEYEGKPVTIEPEK